jgi:hypothetical protein
MCEKSMPHCECIETGHTNTRLVLALVLVLVAWQQKPLLRVVCFCDTYVLKVVNIVSG